MCAAGRTGAHPRVRGDVCFTSSSNKTLKGSPPRARGRPRQRGSRGHRHGLTPACAGTSAGASGRGRCARAHPRVRGDVLDVIDRINLGKGSPPRARGRRRPASTANSGLRSPPRAHPRVRGDVPQRAHVQVCVPGSPPRARGRPRRATSRQPAAGLTPACAGTSWVPARWVRTSRAHPRVRGDVGRGDRPRDRALGSPPRARGRRFGCAGGHVGGGLTPACAGTSPGCSRAAPRRRAHPRVRGDVKVYGHGQVLVVGSPPRARGRPRCDRPHQPGQGLTPACAGTSSGHAKAVAALWAHPRVRGDVLADSLARGEAPGSPPRARGRPTERQQRVSGRGLTPACAGTSAKSPAAPLVDEGSPPRARGRLSGGQLEPSRLGLTPACAGTSPAGAPTRLRHGAHPRVRGDVPTPPQVEAPTAGSPPRARGRRSLDSLTRGTCGLTPACAGTSRGKDRNIGRTEGSPPRARGRLGCRQGVHPARGLTPACAGTSGKGDWRAG